MNNHLDTPTSSPSIPIGRYRHYKGADYEVIQLARHSETREWFVFYRCLYEDYSFWVRPLAMFCEEVVVDGECKPRFAFIGDGEMSDE